MMDIVVNSGGGVLLPCGSPQSSASVKSASGLPPAAGCNLILPSANYYTGVKLIRHTASNPSSLSSNGSNGISLKRSSAALNAAVSRSHIPPPLHLVESNKLGNKSNSPDCQTPPASPNLKSLVYTGSPLIRPGGTTSSGGISISNPGNTLKAGNFHHSQHPVFQKYHNHSAHHSYISHPFFGGPHHCVCGPVPYPSYKNCAGSVSTQVPTVKNPLTRAHNHYHVAKSGGGGTNPFVNRQNPPLLGSINSKKKSSNDGPKSPTDKISSGTTSRSNQGQLRSPSSAEHFVSNQNELKVTSLLQPEDDHIYYFSKKGCNHVEEKENKVLDSNVEIHRALSSEEHKRPEGDRSIYDPAASIMDLDLDYNNNVIVENSSSNSTSMELFDHFYFYDDHWRPTSGASNVVHSTVGRSFSVPATIGARSSVSNDSQTCSPFTVGHSHGGSSSSRSCCSDDGVDAEDEDVFLKSCSAVWNNYHNDLERLQGGNLPDAAATPTINSESKDSGVKSDLSVETNIITLANGHRDLEIRLCYSNSSNSNSGSSIGSHENNVPDNQSLSFSQTLKASSSV